MTEPLYLRFLRGLLHLTEPDVLDAALLGFACGVLLVLIPVLWWIQ